MDTSTENAISVTYRGVDKSETLNQQVIEKMGSLSEKYFNRLVSCEVVFSKLNHHFLCKIRMHMGKLDIMAQGEGYDIRVAFAQAEEHTSKQLRRQKREIREDKPTGITKDQIINNMTHIPRDDDDLTLEEEIRAAANNRTEYDLAIAELARKKQTQS